MINLKMPFWTALPFAALVYGAHRVFAGHPQHAPTEAVLLVCNHYRLCGNNQADLENWESLTKGADGLPGIPRPVLWGIRFNTPHKFYYISLLFRHHSHSPVVHHQELQSRAGHAGYSGR